MYKQLLLVFIFIPIITFAQHHKAKENSFWLTMANQKSAAINMIPRDSLAYGIKFDNNSQIENHTLPALTSIPVFIDNVHFMGFSTVCDNNGELLFYTNGHVVWDKNHNIMPNGWDINKNANTPPNHAYIYTYNSEDKNPYEFNSIAGTSQYSVVSCKVPGTLNKYYIFSAPKILEAKEINGRIFLKEEGNYEHKKRKLHYTIVDMDQNNGLGAVDANTKGVEIAQLNETIYGNLCMTHTDDCGFWLVGAGATSNLKKLDRIFAIKIDGNGIDTNNIVFSSLNDQYLASPEHILISPQRSKIAMVTKFYEATVADFNATTGEVTNDQSYNSILCKSSAFSPNDSFLYIDGSLFTFSQVDLYNAVQQDLLTASGDDFLVATGPKLGSDNRIYFGGFDFGFNIPKLTLGYTINQPNMPASQTDIQQLNPDYGIPYFDSNGLNGLVVPSETPLLQYDTTGEIKSFTQCFGENIEISPVITAGKDYRWYKLNEPNKVLFHSDKYTPYSISEDGAYLVTYFTPFTCEFHLDTLQVTNIDFSVELGEDQIICDATKSQSVQIGQTGPKNASYSWNTGAQTPYIHVRESGMYSLEMNVENCIASDSIYVKITNVHQPIIFSDSIFCIEQKGKSIQLNVDALNTVNILWSTNATTPQIKVSDTGTYFVMLEDEMCIGGDTISLGRDYCNCPFVFPTAFTPNNDGNNDLFKVNFPQECNVTAYQMDVLNRYGQIIFSTTNPQSGWDGTQNGVLCELGTYFYRVQFQSGSNRIATSHNGEVHLIK